MAEWDLISGLTGVGVHLLGRRRGGRGPRARPVRDPVPPRGRAHAVRHADPRDVPARHLRLRHVVVGGVRGGGTGGTHPRAGGRRQGDLRAVRRRRLVGGGAPDLSGGRRPAHLRLRGPRADAQERGQPGGGRVPRRVQGAADRRGRRGAVPAPPGRRDRPGAQAQDHRRGVHPRVRGGGGRLRRRPAILATSSRERSTRT